MATSDVLLEIIYPMSEAQATIKTNLKPDKIHEFLGEYIRSQMGKGKDDRNPEERDVYTIAIGLDLSDDSFTTSSDAGNDSLVLGIVIDIRKNLDSVKIEE